MMPRRGEILRSLAGASRLLLFRGEGLQFFADDPGAAWRSFFAAVLAAPAYYLQIQDLGADLRLEPANLHFVLVWGLTYVLGWVVFPVILLGLGARQGFGARVPSYILFSNWVTVPASYLQLLVADLGGGELLNLLLVLWLIVNNWWILRQSLGIRAGQAAALAVLAEAVNFLLANWAVLRTVAPALQ